MVQTADVAQREKLFTMRMNDEEHARLNDLAQHYGITVAAVLRMLVKAKHDEVMRERERFDPTMPHPSRLSPREHFAPAAAPPPVPSKKSAPKK